MRQAERALFDLRRGLPILLRQPAGDTLVQAVEGLDDDALAALQSLAGAPARLVLGGWLFLEHGYDQAASARGLLADAGFAAIASWADLAGIERVTGGRWLGRETRDSR